jgi:hypothetical protein
MRTVIFRETVEKKEIPVSGTAFVLRCAQLYVIAAAKINVRLKKETIRSCRPPCWQCVRGMAVMSACRDAGPHEFLGIQPLDKRKKFWQQV